MIDNIPKLGEVIIRDGVATIDFQTFLEEISEGLVYNYALEVSRGKVPGVYPVSKFGRCEDNMDLNVDTDVWDGANSATGQPIYVSPTEARIHQIASDSPNDTLGGTGGNQITIYYLPDWDTAEVELTLDMNGSTDVATPACVAINRMEMIPGANSTTANVGTITATADTDNTITAMIMPGRGQTQMAIYAFPSTQTLYGTQAYAGVNRSNAGSCNATPLFNPNPDIQTVAFLTKTTFPANSAGETMSERIYQPLPKFDGPGILKMQGNCSANNMDVSAGFDGYLVDK